MKKIVTIAISLFAASAISARAADANQNWDQASFTDAEAATAIKDGIKEGGKTKMTAFGSKLSDDEIKALVAYVRTLKK